jgi:dipeptidyl aminopeptidase/acylaminoacyl peptidase
VKRGRGLYVLFLVSVVIFLILAAVPIAASDLFRQPYSPAWNTVYDLLDLFHIDPFPTGGGAPPRFPYWHNPADDFIYYRSITLTTADGVNLSAWYVPATGDGPAAAHPAILLAHGLQDRKETMLHLVPWLHKAGYHVMLFDFRGHGASDKRPTTVGRDEALDIEAALDWLETEGVGGSVGGLGMSLGAAALVNAAAQDPRLDALVLDSLFADWSDTDFARDYRLPPDWLVPGVPSPVDLLPEIHAPILIIHGTADILTSVEHAQRLYAAANEPKYLWINDSGHAWSSWTYPVIYKQKILDFFGESLP